jgi:hypothetical protein
MATRRHDSNQITIIEASKLSAITAQMAEDGIGPPIADDGGVPPIVDDGIGPPLVGEVLLLSTTWHRILGSELTPGPSLRGRGVNFRTRIVNAPFARSSIV